MTSVQMPSADLSGFTTILGTGSSMLSMLILMILLGGQMMV